MELVLRAAQLKDAEAIQNIYAHHVLNGTASFDTVPRSLAETRQKISSVSARGWPFLVAENSGTVMGYAYATQFRERAAYASTCENSIYVLADQRGNGIGAALLKELVQHATACGFRQMIAVIGGSEPASIAVHEKLGFKLAGRMKSVGRKKGIWLDTVYMQLPLGEGDASAPNREPV